MKHVPAVLGLWAVVVTLPISLSAQDASDRTRPERSIRRRPGDAHDFEVVDYD